MILIFPYMICRFRTQMPKSSSTSCLSFCYLNFVIKKHLCTLPDISGNLCINQTKFLRKILFERKKVANIIIKQVAKVSFPFSFFFVLFCFYCFLIFYSHVSKNEFQMKNDSCVWGYINFSFWNDLNTFPLYVQLWLILFRLDEWIKNDYSGPS